MNLPPTWVRRLLVAPIVVAICVAVLVSLPVALLVAAALAPLLPGRFRVLRLIWFASLYLALEATGIVVLFALWIVTGFGWQMSAAWCQRWHYVLIGWFLRVLRWEAQRVLGARIESTGWTADQHIGRPIIVLARHAGAGDSFLLVDQLINVLQREPRIVLRDLLQWDPTLDIALNRLPSRFLAASGPRAQAISSITALAENLDGNDALLIFPEGGNFTVRRRQRGIDSLRARGLDSFADRCQAMHWMLAPKSAGSLAALTGAPEADVMLVAHTGMDHIDRLGDMYRYLPLQTPVRLRWWFYPRAEVPDDPDGFDDWLLTQWEMADAWVANNQPQVAHDLRERQVAELAKQSRAG